MAPHLIFFLCILSFLAGVTFASLGLPLFLSSIPATIVFAALFALNVDMRIALFAVVLIFAGSWYYLADDQHYHDLIAHLPPAGSVRGLIANDPRREMDSQSFYLKTSLGKILINAAPYPLYSYGDTLVAEGKIEKPPPGSYGTYLAKEGAVATMRGATLNRVAEGGGNRLLAFLLDAKNEVRRSFKQFLAPQTAALLAGITIGANEDIAKSFLEKLSLSGVRHLTAINGLHMSIAVCIIFGSAIHIMPRRYAFILTFVFIFLFTALTGFTVSAIRATLMAFIASLAKISGKLYAPHNALALAAIVLTLASPKVLVFDAGFQLSFLAVISIIYFMPVLRHLLRMNDAPGIGAWKESLLITLSAQLATAPILIAQFQNFSFTAFIANILIVTILPLIMILGFLTGLLSFLPGPLAMLASLAVAPLIEYVIFIVNVSGPLALRFNPPLGFTGIAAYYAILVLLMWRFYKARPAAALAAN